MTATGTPAEAPAGAPVRRPVLQVVLRAPRPVRVLVFGVFVSRLGSFFATFATLFLTDRGFTPRTVAPVLVGVGLAGMLGSLGGGWMADRVGHRPTLVLSMGASSVAVAMLVVADRPATLVAAVCLVAFWTSAYPPAAAALLVDNSDPVDRVPIFAFFRLALNVGAALGPLLAGVLASRSYTLLFAVEAVAYAACALIILRGLPAGRGAVAVAVAGAAGDTGGDTGGGTADTVAGDTPGGTADEAGGGAPAGASHTRVWVLCGLLFGVAALYAQFQSTLPLQLVSHGFTVTFYGALLALNGFLVITAELPISGVTRRWPWALPLAGGVAVMATGLVLAASGTAASLVIVAFTLFTVGEMIFAPVSNAAVAELSPAGTAARYQGLLATAQTLGFSLGPALGVAVYAVSSAGLWVGVAVTAGALCTGFLVIWRLWR